MVHKKVIKFFSNKFISAKWLFIQVCLIVVISNVQSKDYRDYELLRVYSRDQMDAKYIFKIANVYNIDLWNYPEVHHESPVLILLHKRLHRNISLHLSEMNIEHEIVSRNMPKMIYLQLAQSLSHQEEAGTKFNYDSSYHEFDEILAEMMRIEKTNTSRIKLFSLGDTYERRQIPAIRISNGVSKKPDFFDLDNDDFFDEKVPKKLILLECGAHAREWVSPATCLWIMNDIVTKPNQPALKKHDFVIVPNLNPDGYVYSWEGDRFWRKTRSRSSRSRCRGTDPNRNMNANHCGEGASDDPCHQTYCGVKAHSEPETAALADFLQAHRGQISAYFSLHAYSQLWMYPYGYSTKLPKNNARLKSLSQAAVASIHHVHGTKYTYGTIANTIYVASGSTTDYAYEKAGIPVAFTLELRDRGRHGFMLPAHLIKKTAEEAWAGIKTVVNMI